MLTGPFNTEVSGTLYLVMFSFPPYLQAFLTGDLCIFYIRRKRTALKVLKFLLQLIQQLVIQLGLNKNSHFLALDADIERK